MYEFTENTKKILDTIAELKASNPWIDATFILALAKFEDVKVTDRENLRALASSLKEVTDWTQSMAEWKDLPKAAKLIVYEVVEIPALDRVDAVEELIAGGIENLPHYEVLVAMRDIERANKKYEAAIAARAEAKKAERTAKQNAEAAERAEAKAAEAELLGLAPLTGTPKQRAWAEEIRAWAIQNLPEEKIKKHINRCKTAKWWIEHRAELGWKDQRRSW